MKRYAPLKRKSELKRGAPLRNRGTKARRDETELRAIHDTIVRSGCIAKSESRCEGRVDKHHVLPRSRGGDNSEANLIPLCRKHHRWVHDNPEKAKARGWLR